MIINKKIIAREWLIFIILLVYAFFFMPQFSEVSYSRFFDMLFSADRYNYSWNTKIWFNTWLKLLVPYVIVQIIRSLIWAFSTLFIKKDITN
jgi:hypothetical protein